MFPVIEGGIAIQFTLRCLTRACSGWTQHSGNDSKIRATADAQAVVRLNSGKGSTEISSI
jgi:hypothetical protein